MDSHYTNEDMLSHAFELYAKLRRNEIMQDSFFKNWMPHLITVIIASEWNSMSDEDKARYTPESKTSDIGDTPTEPASINYESFDKEIIYDGSVALNNTPPTNTSEGHHPSRQSLGEDENSIAIVEEKISSQQLEHDYSMDDQNDIGNTGAMDIDITGDIDKTDFECDDSNSSATDISLSPSASSSSGTSTLGIGSWAFIKTTHTRTCNNGSVCRILFKHNKSESLYHVRAYISQADGSFKIRQTTCCLKSLVALTQAEIAQLVDVLGPSYPHKYNIRSWFKVDNKASSYHGCFGRVSTYCKVTALTYYAKIPTSSKPVTIKIREDQMLPVSRTQATAKSPRKGIDKSEVRNTPAVKRKYSATTGRSSKKLTTHLHDHIMSTTYIQAPTPHHPYEDDDNESYDHMSVDRINNAYMYDAGVFGNYANYQQDQIMATQTYSQPSAYHPTYDYDGTFDQMYADHISNTYLAASVFDSYNGDTILNK